MKYERLFSVDRASVDVESGTFRAVVFTDGEASDGHILNIPGGEIPAKMPLFVNHFADPRTQLGSLHLDTVTAHQVVMRGEVFLGGEGPELAVRRDILAKMAAGHVSQMSGRWDANDEDIKRRTELETDHPAYVSPKKAKRDFRFRYGAYFEKWRALEGSIVGLGADQAATMRWAEEAEQPEVRAFWRSIAEGEEEETPAETPTEPTPEESDEPATEPAVEPSEGEPTEEPAAKPAAEPDDGRSVDVAAEINSLLERTGLDPVALHEAMGEVIAPEPTVEEKLDAALERINALESELRDQGRVDGEPSPPPSLRTTQAMFDYLDAKMRASDEKALAMLQAVINTKRGKVAEGQTAQQRLEAEAKALLEEMRAQKGEETAVVPDLTPAFAALDEHLDRSRERLEKALRAAASTRAAESRLADAQEVLRATLRD